ncbi:alpha/beta hydrolase-fold protein [Streptomyces radicis]|uniref:alpha/beta hydrolase-fold protein n=1 Tax=Streptomyces radicis TaxID=1750517 RepID=UPI001E4A62D2|nr:alpha/beta hydrolase-fold protein [Streptomyces radicis]
MAALAAAGLLALTPGTAGARPRRARLISATRVSERYLPHGCCDPTDGWEAWPSAGLEQTVGDLPLLVVCPEGGTGALAYAARHPGLFRAAASFSGVIGTSSSPSLVHDIARGQGVDPAGLWGDPTAQAPTPGPTGPAP